MLKLLRKYNKIILVIFGAFLMVVFLVPHAEQLLRGDPAKAAVGTLDGKKVTGGEINEFTRQLAALAVIDRQLVETGLQIKSGPHWMLLVKAAQRQGMVGHEADGAAMVEQDLRPRWVDQAAFELFASDAEQKQGFDARTARMYAQFMAQQNPSAFTPFREKAEQAIDSIVARQLAEGARRGGFPTFNPTAAPDSPENRDLFQALANLRGVLRLVTTFAQANRLSDTRAVATAGSRAEIAFIDYTLIDPERIAGRVPEPTPEALAAHFAKYQSVDPAKDPHGIGYLREPRVKLEYLVVSRDALAAQVKLDPIEVNKHWMQNRATFKGEFAAERPAVERALRERQIDRLMDEADKAVRAELYRAASKLPVRDGYKVLPPTWETERPRLTDVAQRAVQTLLEAQKLEIATPVVKVLDDRFYTAEDLALLPVVSQAQVRMGSQVSPLSAFLLNARELGVKQTLGLQVGVPFDQPALGAGGDRIYFTLLDARTKSAAESIAEVGADTVAKDAKSLAAFAILQAELTSTQNLAVQDGLAAVANLYALPGTPTPEQPAPTPTPAPIRTNVRVSAQGVEAQDPALRSDALRDAVMTAAAALDPTKPALSQDAAKRTIALALPKNRSVVVAQVTARRPLTREVLRLAGEGLAAFVQGEEVGNDVRLQVFSYEALARRMNFKMQSREDEPTSTPKSATPPGQPGQSPVSNPESTSLGTPPSESASPAPAQPPTAGSPAGAAK